MTTTLSRRDFLRVLKAVGGAVLSFLAASYYGMELEPKWLEVTQVEIPLKRIPKVFDGYRILQISDIHIGGWMNRERLADVLASAREQKPDLIVLTGDYVLGHSWTTSVDAIAEDIVAELSALTLEYKVIGIMGNHDHWTDVEKVGKVLERSGVIGLRNDIHMVVKNGWSLCFAGLDDVSQGEDRLKEFYNRLPVDMDSILLVHEPDYADTAVQVDRFGLQLSGHSHGGQVVLPFIGPPVLPLWARKYPAGLYDLDKMWLYTNRGVGMTSPFIRFNCRPEITVFTLRSA